MDPRNLKALLRVAKEFAGSFQELNLDVDGTKLHVRYGAEQEPVAKPVTSQRMTRAELEVEARKRNEKQVRPALDSFKEKAPVFDFGIKS